MYQTPKRRRFETARQAIGSYIYDGVRRYGPAVVGGFAARAAVGARSLGADMAEAAGAMINDASHRATTAMRGAAERVVNGMAGGAAMNIGDNSMCPAQLIPGRGAELSYQQLNILKAIKFKTGESVGPPLTDAYGREKILYQGQTVMHAFAFKMQLGMPAYSISGDSVPTNRFYCHNVFRHVLAGPNNTAQIDKPYGNRTQSWNETLGPDRSLVRQLGAVVQGASQVGTAYVVPSGTLALNTTLLSPYRYPLNGGFMYSRVTRQMLENMGWNANPIKLPAIVAGTGGLGPGPLQVYNQAQASLSTGIVSWPHQIPVDTDTVSNGPSYYYRSQFGRGQVSYCFNNDGTNPVVIDIVITRIKKGQSLLKGDMTEMVAMYQKGYLNYSYANDGQADLAGQPPAAVDVTTNARGPFLPAKALENYKRTQTGFGSATNTASAPFKQVARDQFIIAGGASRNWSTYLQSMDYRASAFAHYQNGDPGTGATIAGYDDTSNCIDEYSYIFSIACSGVPAPYVEFAGTAGSVASVIDRRGTDCSVSVTGAYKEVPHPVYLTKANKDAYINGRLDVPGFDVSAVGLSLTTNDIANIGQATRGAANSTALIGMGPLNTVGGG